MTEPNPNPGFKTLGRLALRVVFHVPPAIRESVFFGGSPFCVPLQKALHRSLGGSFSVETRFADGPLRGQSFQCWTSEKYFLLGSHFEESVQKIIREIVRPGDVIYDVGGHAGYMSLLFSTLTGPAGRVITFEPSPVNFRRVERNIAANGHTNITAVNLAASNREGDGRLVEQGSESKITMSSAAPNTSSIRMIRLDNFVYRCGNPPPVFMKLDVEGHAGAALDGASRILRIARPKLIFELHDPAEERDALRILAESRYEVAPIDRTAGFPRRMIGRPQ